MDAEVALRLRIEALIAGHAELDVDEAAGALADVEAVATALAATGAMAADIAASLVADTVDALVVRGASWVEPTAVDLDVRRLYDLAAGVPRPRLRRVVAVPGGGALTSVDLWDDRAEVRVVAGPSLHLDAVRPEDRRLELRDDGGNLVAVDVTGGRAGSEGGTVGSVAAAEYLARLEVHATSAARRDGAVPTVNAQRRRLAVVAEALGERGGDAVARFDAAVVGHDDRPAVPTLLEVVAVAVRVPYGWVLSVERWSDHWRAVVRGAEGRALWTALDDAGGRYGGDPMDVDVVRFDPALSDDWARVTLQRLDADGTTADLEVVR